MNTSRLLAIETRVIQSQIHGEMDYSDLEKQLDLSRPALLNLNIGTTFKGAIDQIEQVQHIINKKSMTSFYIHADAALFGGYLPFISDLKVPIIDFEKSGYDSIAISGHKFFGSPIPMGIFLVKKQHLNEMKNDFVEYIYARNVTIPCSRSSLSALLFWWIIRTKSFKEWSHEARQMLDQTHYLCEQLNRRKINAWYHPYSNIVYFHAPDAAVSQKWCLSQIQCPRLGPLAHVVVMQHVTKDLIDEFLGDFASLKMCA